MRRLTILVALAVTLVASASEASKPPSKPVSGGKPPIAQPQAPKGGATKPASAKPASAKPQPPKGGMPKSTTVKASAPKGSTVKVKSTVVASGGKSKQSKSTSGATKANKTTKTTTVRAAASSEKSVRTSKSATTTKAGTTTTSPTTIDFTATKVGQLLQKNSVQRSKLEAKLQAAGYTGTVYEAGYGFKNFGQFNAAMNQVQNFGYSFDLLKVLMTGIYVDPATSQVYRAQQLPDGSVKLVSPQLATNPVSTLSLGQAKQAIAGGAVMPQVAPTTATSPTVSKDF